MCVIDLLRNVLYSIRPSACLGAALFATAAYQQVLDTEAIVIFFSVFSGSACCFIINDIHDREKDLLNGKERPIATGALGLKQARISAWFFGGVYLAMSFRLGAFHLLIFSITMFIFLVYPIVNNRYGLLSNLLVAVSVCLSFIYGAGQVLQHDKILWITILATFFLIIGREIMLDGLDSKGDQAVGKKSIYIKYGEKKTIWIVIGWYVLGSTPLMFLLIESYSFAISLTLIALLAALWIPLIVSISYRKINWMLFNIRTSHLFFALIIMILFIR